MQEVRIENVEFRRGMSDEGEPAKSFEDLIVWQKAHRFVLAIYTLTKQFPKEETYGLTSQLRRASVSIASNIAEGFRKRGRADKARFFNISEGSADECQDYLILIHDLGYASTVQLRSELNEVSKMLNAYRASVLNSNS